MTRKPLTVRQAAAERERGAKFYRSLTPREQGDLGDQLVLGEFDWSEWFYDRPSRAFMNGLDRERILCEWTASS